MHTPYEQIRKHRADFRVKYRFYTEEEGGRKYVPAQGYRSDFWYHHPEHERMNEIFMIHPEFEDEQGTVVLENKSVSASGTALMWVLFPQRRDYHLARIKVGMTAYFMEGGRRTAECEIIEILDLEKNPRE